MQLQLFPAAITGQWFYSKMGSDASGTEVLVDYNDNEAGCTRDHMVINDNGSFSDVDWYKNSENNCEDFTENGSYVVVGNNIVLDYGDGADTYEVLNLSYTELKVKNGNDITILTR